MQPLTAAPRSALTPAQIAALLTAPDLSTDFGADLLAADLSFIEDISADVAGGTVQHDNLTDIHGTVDLTITRELAWGRDRVRPFMLLTSATAGVSARFNLGVYLLTTPSTPLAESPITYDVTGFDQLHILQDSLGDSYSVTQGANVLASVRAALVAAGITAPVLLDSTATASVLASNMAWPMTSSDSPTWITVVNALLKSINYAPIWCDQDGAFRSGPFVAPADRPPEWTFTVGDLIAGVVASERTVENDVWNVPNWWRFVTTGFTTSPAEGEGQYTAQNLTTGLASQASVGRVVHAPIVSLDAVDQASLVAQGDALVAAAMRTTEVIEAHLSPFPILWHEDVASWADPALGSTRKVAIRSWSMPLDGSDCDITLETI